MEVKKNEHGAINVDWEWSGEAGSFVANAFNFHEVILFTSALVFIDYLFPNYVINQKEKSKSFHNSFRDFPGTL